MIPEMLSLDHLVKLVWYLLLTKICLILFFKLLEEKILELRRHEEKSSSHTDELTQVIKVNKQPLSK